MVFFYYLCFLCIERPCRISSCLEKFINNVHSGKLGGFRNFLQNFYKIMQNEFLLLGIYSQLIKMCSNIIKILKKLLSKKAEDYNSISIFISLQQVYK